MRTHPYAFLGLLAVVAIALPLVMLAAVRLWFVFFQPLKPSKEKNRTYECGVIPSGDSWIQFKAHYYLYGILFLIFDVEVLFLLPCAVAFTSVPPGAFISTKEHRNNKLLSIFAMELLRHSFFAECDMTAAQALADRMLPNTDEDPQQRLHARIVAFVASDAFERF